MSNKREYNKSLKMFFGFEDEYDYEFSKYPTKKIIKQVDKPIDKPINLLIHHTDLKDSIEAEFLCEIKGSFNPFQDYGSIIVNNSEHKVEVISIKMHYKNGQAGNMQEVELTENTDELKTRLETPNAKFYEFSLKSTERNVLQNDFALSMEYSFFSHPDSFSSNFRIEIEYFHIHTSLEYKKIESFNEEITGNLEVKLGLNFDEIIDPYYRMSLEERAEKFRYSLLRYALNMEDLENIAKYDKFSLYNESIFKTNNGYYGFNTEVLQEKRKELKLLSRNLSLCFARNTDTKPLAYKEFTWSGDMIEFEYLDHQSRSNWRKDIFRASHKFNICFIPNRSSFRVCYDALNRMKGYRLEEFYEKFEVIPYQNQVNKSNLEEKVEKFEWFDDKISSNEEQMIAIKNVVNCTAFPFPYVIFGPPGTGKTSTLVECVAQIMKHKPNSHILISAQSNSACDEIGKRLTEVVSYIKILRFCSSSIIKSQGSEQLHNISNSLCNGNDPSYEELYHFNIVIITLSTSSRLIRANIDPKHFNYLFIDECGAATELESLVPIIGLGAQFHEITANVVLLGDHKQLGPVLASDFASKMGLSISLLERIMSIPKYSSNPTFNNKYIVQLLDNYRSHPAILQFSNTEFYDSKLRSKMSNEDMKITENFSFLTDKSFPIVFHSVLTPNEIDDYQTSSHNIGEINIVKLYVDLLMKTKIGDKNINEFDIGIVSPYKSQLSKLHETFKDLQNIEIGTAEYYQGREKRIIIISTVRSENSVGFLKSEKRLNVMLTRAKSLLIIVGNPETLQKDSLWRKFINFCSQNNAFAGEPFKLKSLTVVEEESVEKLTNALNQFIADAEKSEDEEDEKEDNLNNNLQKRLIDLQKHVENKRLNE